MSEALLLPDALTQAPLIDARRWVVAYSGGVDSHVLLHQLVCLRDALGERCPALVALHVNHGVSAGADRWQVHCEAECARLGVEIICTAVRVDCAGGQGFEAAARRARYAAFERFLSADDLLLLAHHADDQVETFFLRLLRGAGMRGLSAMPQARAVGKGRLFRPLLAVSRDRIEAYARAQQLLWIEDESNRDQQLDRNYLRASVLPVLHRRWPGATRHILKAARFARESVQLAADLAAIDAHSCRNDDGGLTVQALRSLAQRRQVNLLRHWLAECGAPAPSDRQLQTMLSDVLEAADDASPLLAWGGWELRRFSGALYAMPALSPHDAAGVYRWRTDKPLTIPGMGTLHADPVCGRGLRAAAAVEVRFRRGGERCRPLGRRGSAPLKKLLQAYRVPPWRRERLPLIYVDGELAAVADLWVCEPFAAGADEPGLVLRWVAREAIDGGVDCG